MSVLSQTQLETHRSRPTVCQFFSEDYRNDTKFSDRLAWANSADPDQTASRAV